MSFTSLTLSVMHLKRSSFCFQWWKYVQIMPPNTLSQPERAFPKVKVNNQKMRKVDAWQYWHHHISWKRTATNLTQHWRDGTNSPRWTSSRLSFILLRGRVVEMTGNRKSLINYLSSKLSLSINQEKGAIRMAIWNGSVVLVSWWQSLGGTFFTSHFAAEDNKKPFFFLFFHHPIRE